MFGQYDLLVVVQQAVPSAPERAEELLGTVALALAVAAGLLVLLAAKAGRVALSLWLSAVFPRLCRTCAERYRMRPWASFFVGAVNLFIGVLLGLLMLRTGVLALLGIALLGGMGLLSVVGYGAAYGAVGARLFEHMGTHSPVRMHILGGIVTEVAFLTPVLGLLLSLGVLCRGFGAALMALISFPRDPQENE